MIVFATLREEDRFVRKIEAVAAEGGESVGKRSAGAATIIEVGDDGRFVVKRGRLAAVVSQEPDAYADHVPTLAPGESLAASERHIAQILGHTILLYREHPETPRFVLP